MLNPMMISQGNKKHKKPTRRRAGTSAQLRGPEEVTPAGAQGGLGPGGGPGSSRRRGGQTSPCALSRRRCWLPPARGSGTAGVGDTTWKDLKTTPTPPSRATAPRTPEAGEPPGSAGGGIQTRL